MRRECTKVIKTMIALVPKNKEDLIERLNWHLVDASLKAPEQNIQWVRLSETIQEYFINPKEDWEIKLLSVFSCLPENDIKKEIAARNKGTEERRA
jgi:hypothetical protein